LSAKENELRFNGLTVVKVDANTCKHIVTLKDKGTNQTKDVEILYHRVKE